jgi:hypothetical protein
VKGAEIVVQEGTSFAQQDYIRKQIASVAAEGGTPVLRYDKTKAPSGAAVWWSDIHQIGLRGEKASTESKATYYAY